MSERPVSVDVGCGQTNNLAYYGGDGEPSVAIDIDRGFLNKRSLNGSKGNLVEGVSARLPLVAGSADKVFAIHSLEHVEDFSGSLDELARVVKPGGKLIVAFPHERYEMLMSKLDPEYHSPKMHLRVISEDMLRTELENRGFNFKKVAKRGFTQAVVTTFLFLVHRKVLNDREMEPQSGHLIGGDQDSIDTIGNKQGVGRIKNAIKSTPFMKVFGLLDNLYPFEVFVIAEKVET